MKLAKFNAALKSLYAVESLFFKKKAYQFWLNYCHSEKRKNCGESGTGLLIVFLAEFLAQCCPGNKGILGNVIGSEALGEIGDCRRTVIGPPVSQKARGRCGH